MRCDPAESGAKVETKLRGLRLVTGVAGHVAPSAKGAGVGLHSGGEPRDCQAGDAANRNEGELKTGVANGERARNKYGQGREGRGIEQVEIAIEESAKDDGAGH